MDLTLQVPILLFTASNLASITSPIHNWVLFLLWLCPFILSGVSSPRISSSILGTNRPGEFFFQCPIFCLFILFMGFSRQEYWSGLPFPSPVDHVLSELFTMTCPSWVALHDMVHSFSALDKAVIQVIVWLVFCNYSIHSVCPLIDKDQRLVESSWWEGLAVGESGSCSDGRGHAR